MSQSVDHQAVKWVCEQAVGLGGLAGREGVCVCGGGEADTWVIAQAGRWERWQVGL
jgi:hypothetical protein